MNNDMIVERYAKVLLNDRWHKVDFARLRRDDIFRLFEPDGTQTGGTFIAKSSPYKVKLRDGKSTLTVNCEKYE